MFFERAPRRLRFIEGGVLSRIYGLDSICPFCYICGQFVLHYFECIIAFVVNFHYICGQLLHLWLQHGLLSYLLTYLTTDPPTYYRYTHLPSYPNQKEAYLLKQELNLYQIINYNSHELILAAGRVSE